MMRLQLRLTDVGYAFILLFMFSRQAEALDCFRCDSTSEITCSENLPWYHMLEGESCDDIYDARYCVKMTGIFEGTVLGLECYQCDSSKGEVCPEEVHAQLHEDPIESEMKPESCDGVFEAKYCVKTTGMFEGELGTKRFCSARDWGNYCEWIQRPADEREYRACIFTCTGNNCNTAHRTHTPVPAAAIATALLTLLLSALVM
ncbi:glycosylphosphatidylinositol anchored membrane protein boudin isoform X2 [Oratosquilla oratoria]|uniref:glycosylphosphatidylinositol anchored membrane protein boudin isoform X2 n=1 Tax=Oratosquilla oratoria TaxID=337810 RepID=UPI003F77790E